MRQQGWRLLAELLWTVADAERKVEQQRLALCQSRDFVPYAAFKAVDRLGLGRVDAADVMRFLRDSGISHSELEVRALVKQYDGNEDQRLSEAEFDQVILPASDIALRTAVTQRVRPAVLSAETSQAFRDLLETELRFQQRVEAAKTALFSQSGFSLVDAFRAVDSGNMGYLDRAALKWFLRKYEYDINNSDLDAIFRRWDTDDDERLSYREFTEAMASLNPSLRVERISVTSQHSESRKSESVSVATPVSKSEESQPFRPSEEAQLSFRPSEEPQQSSVRPSEEPRRSTSLSTGLTEAEKAALVDSFHEQVVNLRELELLKQEAALCPDFNTENAFALVDLQDTGAVTPEAFSRVVLAYGIKVYGDDAQLLIRKHAANNKLTLAAFTAMVSPLGESYRRLLNSHPVQPIRSTDRHLSLRAGTRTKYIDLLRLLLHIEHRNEVRRQGYRQLKAFHPDLLFALLTQNEGLLTAPQLKRFLSEYGVYASDKEVEVLILQYAGNGATEVSQEDFLREVTPHSSQEYL